MAIAVFSQPHWFAPVAGVVGAVGRVVAEVRAVLAGPGARQRREWAARAPRGAVVAVRPAVARQCVTSPPSALVARQCVAPPPSALQARQCAAAPQRALPSQRVLARPLRVRGTAGRLVISGRLADVCAELDRLAALEATGTR